MTAPHKIVDSWEYWAYLTVEELFTLYNDDPSYAARAIPGRVDTPTTPHLIAAWHIEELRDQHDDDSDPTRDHYRLVAHSICSLWRNNSRLVGTHRLNLTNLLASKQHDYGHGNILAFGHQGIIVRLSDKWERYINLIGRNATPRNETLLDTINDLLGYCVIGMMLLDGKFRHDLAGDYEPQEPSGE